MLYLFLHFVTCTLFFAFVQRPLFIAHNYKLSKTRLTFGDVLDIYRHGFNTDLKVAAYLTAVPLLLVWAHTLFATFPVESLLVAYDIIAAVAVSLLVLSDTILYGFWQYKIEKSVLVYLRHPGGPLPACR